MTAVTTRPDNDDTERDHPSQFSLFEGDLASRAFGKLGIGARRPMDLIARMLIILCITWVPMAFLSYLGPAPDPEIDATNFFLDFAAYAQFFVGIPLYILAEKIISSNVLEAARDFDESGVVRAEDRPMLHKIEEQVAVLRKKLTPEFICIFASFYMAFWAIGSELFWDADGMMTWHSYETDAFPYLNRMLTPAGAYAMFVALPIQTYWWVRWVWKIGIWYWYLRQVSKFKLVLVASHPDHTGGIGFLSEVQAKFAIVILAYGVSSVIATVGYKIMVEHAPVSLPPVWGMVLGFIFLAPPLFLAPLLLFTKQLARTKKRAMNQFREKAMAAALRAEQQWMQSPATPESDEQARNELSQLNLLSGFYERINGMRVVPFDLRSAAQLFGSAIGPTVPLLPYFVELPEPWQAILEAMTKWLPH